jgi:homoserine dehydrogenase
MRKIEEFESRYYIRFMAIDKPGMLAKIAGVLGHYGISIASVTQKERKHAKIVPIVMITHNAQEGPLRKALHEIDNLSVVKDNSIAIRMEDI